LAFTVILHSTLTHARNSVPLFLSIGTVIAPWRRLPLTTKSPASRVESWWLSISVSAADQTCRAATQRLKHSSDHYGCWSRSGHKNYLEEAAVVVGHGGQSTPARRDLYYDYMSQEPTVGSTIFSKILGIC